jgi:SAM-dependent methyltransferase
MGPDRVADSINAYADHAEDYREFNAGEVEETVDRFCATLTVDDVIFDAGCGPGRDLARFAERGFCCIGVDLSPAFVDMATHATDGWPVHVHLGDLRNLPLPDNSAAATWACASLVHLDEHDAATALHEIVRVTRPGGQVYVSVKAAGTTGWHTTRHGRRWFNIWDPDRFATAVSNAGMDVCDVDVGEFVNVWATTSRGCR